MTQPVFDWYEQHAELNNFWKFSSLWQPLMLAFSVVFTRGIHVFFCTLATVVWSCRKTSWPRYAKPQPGKTSRTATAADSVASFPVKIVLAMPSTAPCWPHHSASFYLAGGPRCSEKLKSTTTTNWELVVLLVGFRERDLDHVFLCAVKRKWGWTSVCMPLCVCVCVCVCVCLHMQACFSVCGSMW